MIDDSHRSVLCGFPSRFIGGSISIFSTVLRIFLGCSALLPPLSFSRSVLAEKPRITLTARMQEYKAHILQRQAGHIAYKPHNTIIDTPEHTAYSAVKTIYRRGPRSFPPVSMTLPPHCLRSKHQTVAGACLIVLIETVYNPGC